MTETEKKALALVNAAVSAEQMRILPTYVDKAVLCEALFRAIEQHDAFRQEVSAAVEDTKFMVETHGDTEALALVSNRLNRFIIAKPDPLEEVWNDMGLPNEQFRQRFNAALAARGLEVRKIEEGE